MINISKMIVKHFKSFFNVYISNISF